MLPASTASLEDTGKDRSGVRGNDHIHPLGVVQENARPDLEVQHFLLAEQRRCLPSIAIPRLKKIAARFADLINEPVLLRDASGPAPGQHILQLFRLADALKWIPERGLHKLQDPKCGVAVRFDPEAEGFEKLAMKDGVALSALQARSPAAAVR